MRLLIFGASGMLGHKLYQCLGAKFEVLGTVRSGFDELERYQLFEPSSIITNTDVTNADDIERAIAHARPDCVINAVGIIKQVPTSKDVIQTLTINSIFPQRLAELSAIYGFRLITISTDCVFDGSKGNYNENDLPNARDLYGMSKFLGEVKTPNSLVIRTSIIGRELGSHHSVVEWFLSNRGRSVKGYTNAIYTGFPTVVLAGIIDKLLTEHPSLNGLYHVSSDPISKFELLRLINEEYNAAIEIEPFDEYVIDRSLDSHRFRELTGFTPPSWESMITQMAADPTPYDKWR